MGARAGKASIWADRPILKRSTTGATVQVTSSISAGVMLPGTMVTGMRIEPAI